MMNNDNLARVFQRRADAAAFISGSEKHNAIRGRVLFYGMRDGVLVRAEISGLPVADGECKNPIFALHIHSGTECAGNQTDAFAKANGHYNPNNCPHPYHAGDLPPLFAANGRAILIFLTDRFTVREILGKTIIIHSRPDDFTTQPAGNAGEKIACGIINPTAR